MKRTMNPARSGNGTGGFRGPCKQVAGAFRRHPPGIVAIALLATLMAGGVQAQGVELTEEQYEQMKLAGTLPDEFHVVWSTLPPPGGTSTASHGQWPTGRRRLQLLD